MSRLKVTHAIYLLMLFCLTGAIALFLVLPKQGLVLPLFSGYILLIFFGFFWLIRTIVKPLNQLLEATDYDPTGTRISTNDLLNAPEEFRHLRNNFERLFQHVATEVDNTQNARNAELRAVARLNAMTDNVSLSIITIDTQGIIKHFNPATPTLFGQTPQQLNGAQITKFLPRLNIHGGLFKQMLNAGVDIDLDAVISNTIKPVELSCVKFQFSKDSLQYILILHDISQRKNYEDRLKNLNQKLINTSRQAGIAEIATSILHNVGNVLNSVNTSVSMLRQGLDQNQADGLRRSVEMLKTHGAQLFEANAKGPQLISYLEALTEQMAQTKDNNLRELSTLKQNVHHIAEIVSAQQKFAGKSGVVESLNLARLIEEALSINLVSIENNQVEIERDFDPVIDIKGDRSKIVQILVNLIRNANEAMMPPQSQPPKITISTLKQAQQITISVQDTGEGISEAHMNQMFRYGFTTKSDGHGFGLHSCALAAKDMKGKLEVYSAGKGKGARFELTLPVDAEELTENHHG